MNKAYEEHLDRVMAAVNLEAVDRVPYMPCASAANANLCGVSLADYCADMPLNAETNLKGYQMCGEPDGVQTVLYSPHGMTVIWLGKAMVPGVDLPADQPWQMDERGVLTQDDYEQIISEGYNAWLEDVYVNRLGNPLSKMQDFFAYTPEANRIFEEAGIPNFMGFAMAGPIEMLCGGRTLIPFMSEDLFDEPELVERAMDVMHEARMAEWEATFNSPAKPVGVWVGGWRGTPDILSCEMFLKYAWKYMADIFRAAEILEGHSCIMGDVPNVMTSFGTPDEVDAYCERLIKEVGPRGFILSTGCETPPNAKLETLKVTGAAPAKYAHAMK